LAVKSVEKKHDGNWRIPDKKMVFMKEKLKVNLVMNLSYKIAAYDPK
jgi:hypothetical protein